MRRLTLFSAICILIAVETFAQKVILNKNYRLDNSNVDIILTPVFSKASQKINNAFFKAFNNEPFSVVDTSKILHNMLNHETFNNSLRKTVYVKFEESVLKSKPNLYSFLDSLEIQDFKKNTLGARLIVIISSLTAKNVKKINGSGNVQVTGAITVFDLSTGEFVIHCQDKAKVKFERTDMEMDPPIENLAEKLYHLMYTNLR